MVSTECLPPVKTFQSRGFDLPLLSYKNTKPSVFQQLPPGCPAENRRRALKILTFWNNKTQSSNTLLRQAADLQIQVSASNNSYNTVGITLSVCISSTSVSVYACKVLRFFMFLVHLCICNTSNASSLDSNVML